MATRKIVPRSDNEGGIGTAAKRWASGYFATIFVDSDVSIPVGNAIYLGSESVDGSWRIIVSGTSLSIQKREGGTWVEKGQFTA